MASKGRFAKPPEWWKHLRKQKRTFWKEERAKGKAWLRKNTEEDK